MSEKDIQIQGLRLRVRDEGSGEPVVLLHGFPDSAAVWRHQIPALTDAGFRVVAPDLRGLGASDKPDAPRAYRLEHVIGDVLGIMDTLAIERAHVIGHDWGATTAWLVAGTAPTRVDTLTVLSTGHPQSFLKAGLDQREKSWYMLLFQFQDVAEKLLTVDNWRLFRDLFRHHPEIEQWISAFEQPGALTAGLNWYRANMHPAQSFKQAPVLPRVAARTLGVWSSNDYYLTEAQMLGSAAYVDGPWRYERIEAAGHWMQLDRPDAVNRILLDFLGSG